MQVSDRWASPDEIFAEIPLRGDTPGQYTILLTPESYSKTRTLTKYISLGVCNTLCIGTTRSGKGVSVIIPAALTWTGSLIAVDSKGEISKNTAAYREIFNQKVFHLHCRTDGHSPSSAGFNPFDQIRWKTPFEDLDVRKTVSSLVYDGANSKDYWKTQSVRVICAIATHLYYADAKPPTLESISDFVTTLYLSGDSTSALDEIMHFRHDPQKQMGWMGNGAPSVTHPMVVTGLASLLNCEESQRSGVLSAVESTLSCFRDPILAAITAKSTFSVEDLLVTPFSFYLQPELTMMEHTRSLLRCFIDMVVNRMLEKAYLQGDDDGKMEQMKNPLLLLLDDGIYATGKLRCIEESYWLLRSCGITTLMTYQCVEQLEQSYPKTSSLEANADVLIAFGATSHKTADWLSKRFGQVTVERSVVVTEKDHDVVRTQTETKEVSTPLLSSQEILAIPDKAFVLASHMKPMCLNKIPYWQDPICKTMVNL